MGSSALRRLLKQRLGLHVYAFCTLNCAMQDPVPALEACVDCCWQVIGVAFAKPRIVPIRFGSFSDPWSNQAMPRLLGHLGMRLECLASRQFVGGAVVPVTVCQSGSPQG